MALIKKAVKKVTKPTPIANEEVVSKKIIKKEVEKAPETVLVVSEKDPVEKKGTLIDIFMTKVDFLIFDVYKMYDRKMLTREEIEAIANSVLK